jgi:glycine dehydrogenase
MVADGDYDSVNNPLKNAPHNLELLLGDYELPYSREVAGYPLEFLKKRGKVFPSVGKIDSIGGDKKIRLEYDD